MVKKCLEKIREWYQELDTPLQCLLQGFFFGIGCMATLVLLAAIFLGCTPEPKKAEPVKTPVAVVPPVPQAGPVILAPGQTAMLLEPIQALARVPYQGGKLYEGPVLFQAGSMVAKPKVER